MITLFLLMLYFMKKEQLCTTNLKLINYLLIIIIKIFLECIHESMLQPTHYFCCGFNDFMGN